MGSRVGFSNSVQSNSDVIRFFAVVTFFLPSYDLIFADLAATSDIFCYFLQHLLGATSKKVIITRYPYFSVLYK